jgi:hypothetical protein
MFTLFTLRNFTGIAFRKVGKGTFEFVAGFVDELTFNVTGAAAANAAQIPEDINVKFISKDQFITGTSAVVGSKIGQAKIVELIVGATPNLLI